MGSVFSQTDAAVNAFLREKSVDKVSWVPKYKSWNQAAKERVRTVIESDTLSRHETVRQITFQSEFTKFCEECPAWLNKNVTLFWRNYGDIPDLLVLRRVHSSLSSLQAAVVLQHYLVCICCGKSGVGVIDTTSYIRMHWRSHNLADYLLSGWGPDSNTFSKKSIVTWRTSRLRGSFWTRQEQNFGIRFFESLL